MFANKSPFERMNFETSLDPEFLCLFARWYCKIIICSFSFSKCEGSFNYFWKIWNFNFSIFNI